jgi:hypothetical protein
LTEEQLRKSFAIITGVGRERTPAEEKREVDEAMAKDPRFSALAMVCGTSNESIILTANGKYADVPFEPRSYPVLNTEDKNAAGYFHLMFRVGNDAYEVDGEGKVDLQKFDLSGARGSFSFKARPRFGDTSDDKLIEVKGTFDYPCKGELCKG